VHGAVSPSESNSCLGPSALQAARDPTIQIPPEKVPLLYGLACSIHFLLPAAYYFAAKWCEGLEGRAGANVAHTLRCQTWLPRATCAHA